MSISKELVAFLNACKFTAPFDFSRMDIKVLTANAGFNKLSVGDKVALAKLLKDAKGIVVPEKAPAKGKREPKIGEGFSSIYRGSSTEGGYKVFGIAEKTTEGKGGKMHYYLPQVGMTIVPVVDHCEVKEDAFDEAKVFFKSANTPWSDELLKSTLEGLTLKASTTEVDPNAFMDTLVVHVMAGVEIPLLEYLRSEVIPNIASPKSVLFKQNEKGFIKLVSTHWTQKETPFRA